MRGPDMHALQHSARPCAVTVDLDAELARIEADNRREEAIEQEASAFILRSSDAAFGAFVRRAAIRDADLYAAIYDAAEEWIKKGESL